MNLASITILVLFTIVSVGTAYGHGIGIESSQPVLSNDREIKVTVELLPSDFYQSDQKIIKINAHDETNREVLTNTNFNVEIVDDENILFNDSFFAEDGILIIDENTTGPIFDNGGIFTFRIVINAEDELGKINDMEFEAQVSVTEITHHTQKTQDAPIEFRVKSYYDNIAGFEYNTDQKTATVTLPFDWKETNISHTNVIHAEIMFPKNFVEFLAPHYIGTANGIELFKASVFVDDYSEEENRMVHFILLKDHIRHLKTQLKKIGSELPENLELTLTRGEELKFPLKTLTLSEEFQVDLSWDPKEIKPNVPVKFIYTFRNPVDQGPIRNSDYTFTLLQNGKEIFSKSDNAKIGGDYSEFTFSGEQNGLTIARFSNISGSGQQTEFAFLIGFETQTTEQFTENQLKPEEQSGGGCLIATAAFGSEMEPQVQFLRELRDNTVLQTQAGISFITAFNSFYYSFSPAVADYERENPIFKEAVKLALTPLLTSLMLLNYVDIDTEQEMLGYGIGVILLNIGMYFVAPAVVIISLKNRIKVPK
jgi:hypothetical protein